MDGKITKIQEKITLYETLFDNTNDVDNLGEILEDLNEAYSQLAELQLP